ncbi:MAG TPA: DNA topoisomerase 3, partial [Prolixibacteraceae bacterium]|nr:DNA topoisomerase 3 [Prolixibacteraceae bacterium]
MKVCIAEKPSVAREISRILNANSRKDGYFEGNGYQVTWTFGHLCTLKTPDDYTPQWKSWRLNMLPMIPPRFGIKLIDNDGIEKQFNTIKTLLDNCDEVVNCGDAGIEGEVIQRWVILKAQCTKPLKRLWISSMTDEAIKEGFAKLKNGNDFDRLYAAGNARAVGDWLLGMNASRLYTLKYANGKGVLSIGRVQTPTLALIVNRYEEIQNFVPEPFWEIKTNYRDVTFNSTTGRYKSVEEAQKVLEEIKPELLEIESFSQKKGKEAPPKLFDLTALQVECNKKLNFSADETLKYIQSLYEKKMVTYPRVDTTFLPTDMHPKIPGILKKMEPYSNFTQPILQKPIKKNKKIFDDKKITDHHAIVPTGVAPTGLQQEEKRVYDAIARRFIAAFYPDCMVMNTTVMAKVAGHKFKATGKVIESEGWRVLYPKKSEKGGDKNEQLMPHFEKGEKGEHTPDLLEKQTQPPKLFTEASLLRAMETAGKQVDDEELREAMKENGIGRPSTRSNIIETLFRRRFVVRERKNLVPTQTGVELIHTIKNDLLKSAELTGIWENKLRLIEKGEYDAKQFLEEMKQMVTDLVIEVKRENHKTITI